MSLSLAELAGLLGLPLLAGVGVLGWLRIPFACARAAWLAWAWLAGTLVLGLFLYAWVHACWPLERAPLAFGALALVVCASGCWRLHTGDPAGRLAAIDDDVRQAPRWERALWRTCVLALVALACWRVALSTATPVLEGDEANYWTLRAKLLWRHGGIDAGFLADSVDTELIYHPAYPFFNALLQLWSFAWAGAIDPFAARLIVLGSGPALWLALAGLLARSARPALGAALLLALSGLPVTQAASRVAESDMLSALGMVVAFDGWLRAREGRREGWRVLALGCAYFLWAKNEGLMWVPVALAAALVAAFLPGAARWRELRPRRAWAFALLPIAPIALTLAYNTAHGFRNDLTSGDYRGEGMLALFFEQWSERAWPVLEWFARNVWLDVRESGGLFALAALLVVAQPRWLARRELAAAWLALGFAWCGLFAVYVGTPHPHPWHLETSARRVAWTLLPIAAVLIARHAALLLPGCSHRAERAEDARRGARAADVKREPEPGAR